MSIGFSVYVQMDQVKANITFLMDYRMYRKIAFPDRKPHLVVPDYQGDKKGLLAAHERRFAPMRNRKFHGFCSQAVVRFSRNGNSGKIWR